MTLHFAVKTVLDAGTGLSAYLWSTGENSQTILADSIGNGIGVVTYEVTGTNSDGCTGSDDVTVTFDLLGIINKRAIQKR